MVKSGSPLSALLKLYIRRFPVREGKRLLYNGLCRELAAASEVVRTRDGFILELDPRDENQRHIYWYGESSETDEVRLVMSLLDEGECFLDVGANIGYFALAAARKVGPGGTVVAFEPNPYTFAILKKNLELNGFKQVELRQEAAADENGEATLNFRAGCADANASLANPSGGHDNSVTVKKVTLDSVITSSGLKPAAIKIDTEGFDLFVLKGLSTTLASSEPPALLTETTEGQAKIFDFMSSLDYLPYSLKRHRWSRCEDGHESFSNNTLWLREDSAEKYLNRMGGLLK